MDRCLMLISAILTFLFLCPLITSCSTLSERSSPSPSFQHIMLFSWDGVQYNHLIQLYEAGNLTNLKQLVNQTKFPIIRALITDHLTETNNAHPSILSGIGQGEVDGCPDNITIWENIEHLDSTWVTGAVAGKAKFTNVIFPYAHSDVDYWYAADTSAGQVTERALGFVSNHSKDNFFLFVHYREPDRSGHLYGEGSLDYDHALIECDAGLGRIMSALDANGIRDSTAIVVTTDHGFQEDGHGHTSPAWGADNGDADVFTTWIACSEGSVNQSVSISNFWDQNDVAPTIYALMGLGDYSVRWPYIRGSAVWHRSFEARDVAVTEVQPISEISTGRTVMFSVTVQNQGDFTEIPTLALCCNNSVIGTKTLAYPLSPLSCRDRGASLQTIFFMWNTTGISRGVYVISASVSLIPADRTNHPGLAYTQNETDRTNNIGATDVLLCDLRDADINSDGKIDLLDITVAVVSYGLAEGDVGYNPLADIAPTLGKIDILDLVIIAAHCGEKYS